MDVLTHLYKSFREVPAQLRKVIDGITEIVGGSFLVDGATMTRSEIKHRFEICAKWTLVFRRDLKWSIERILDELPKALRCDLDRIPYTPSREGARTWSADNGRNLIYVPD